MELGGGGGGGVEAQGAIVITPNLMKFTIINIVLQYNPCYSMLLEYTPLVPLKK